MCVVQREQELSGKQRIIAILRYWLPLASYLGAIFYFSNLSDPTPGVDVPINDKVIHFLQYFPLPFLFFRAFKNAATRAFKSHYFLYGIALAVLYALSDEFHQSFIALRDASLFDFAADVGGIMLGAIIMKEVTW
jgi:VanZ family protein